MAPPFGREPIAGLLRLISSAKIHAGWEGMMPIVSIWETGGYYGCSGIL
jgi:hypothetical protein